MASWHRRIPQGHGKLYGYLFGTSGGTLGAYENEQALVQTIRLKVAVVLLKTPEGCRQIHGLDEAVASLAAILGSLRR